MKRLERRQGAGHQDIQGIRTLHDSHIQNVHLVAVFAHRDDTPDRFVPMVDIEHPKLKCRRELSAPWLWH